MLVSFVCVQIFNQRITFSVLVAIVLDVEYNIISVTDVALPDEKTAESEELPQDDNFKYAGTLLTVSELGFNKQTNITTAIV